MSFTKSICGDGICKESEIGICELDCLETCETGSINESCSLGFAQVYLELADQGLIDANYLKESDIYDYTNSAVQAIAKELKRETPKETAKAIADWVYNNIDYDSTNKYYDCRNVKASEIIGRGYGICSTQSKVNIALLRANGIPAYSVTGCFVFNKECTRVQTFFAGRLPQFIDIFVDESGYAPTYGYLHNWVELPLYEDGVIEFVFLEPTTGHLFKNQCVNYREYYSSPPDSLACGLSQFDPSLEDCRQWKN